MQFLPGYNRPMKRLALSILLGVVIPFLYAIVVGLLTAYIENRTVSHYLIFPVRWPILILFRLVPLDVLNEVIMVVALIVGNVLLYTLLSYCLLLAFSKPKTTSRLPPPPQHS